MTQLRDYFEARVSPEPNTGCWLWVGELQSDGRYGRLKVNGRRKYAHRLSLELHGRGDGEGLCACHRCNNPMCVNPDHIYWGTAKENMNDARVSGRMAVGFRLPQTKYSPADIQRMRALAAGGMSHREIGRLFGTSKDYTWQLVNHGTRRWRDRKADAARAVGLRHG